MPDSDERAASTLEAARRPYTPPRITVMDEAEILKAFQITSAATSWWVLG